MQQENRTRNRCFTVRLLEEELAILDAKKDEAEMSKSEYIRNMILFGVAHERTNFSREDTKAIRNALNHIGNNLNQLAYGANLTGNVDEAEWQKMIANYLDLLGQFEKTL